MSRLLVFVLVPFILLPGCFGQQDQLPAEEQSAVDLLMEMTAHKMLLPWRSPNLLASGLDTDEFLGRKANVSPTGSLSFGPKAWNGEVAGLGDVDQEITIVLAGERFIGFKNVISNFFGLSFSSEREYRVELDIDWHAISLQSAQPTLEFLGDIDAFEDPFVSSIAYASTMRIETFVQESVDAGTPIFKPAPMVDLGANLEVSNERSNFMDVSNVIFGYKTTEASNWVEDRISKYPQIELEILNIEQDEIIPLPSVDIELKVHNYSELGENAGRLQLYAWVQQTDKNFGTISPLAAPRDLSEGLFRIDTQLGHPQDGDGKEYSIVVFALFYRLNNITNNQGVELPETSFTRPARSNGEDSVIVRRIDGGLPNR